VSVERGERGLMIPRDRPNGFIEGDENRVTGFGHQCDVILPCLPWVLRNKKERLFSDARTAAVV